MTGSTGKARRASSSRRPAGERFCVDAKRETILAAGAIGSPQLLQLSGIGPGELLQEHGIPVVHELPGVGENLHDHLQIRMQYKVRNVTTLNGVANSLVGKAAMALEYFLFRTGPAHHAAVAARRVREERPVAADAEHRVARAAALARQVRRPAAPVPGDHAERVQPAAELARLGAHQVAGSRRLPARSG